MSDSSTAQSDNPTNISGGMSGGNPFAGGGASGFGGGVFGDPLAPAEGYEYDFASSELSMRTPFDGLIGLPGIDNLGDIFGAGDMEGENPFAGGGAPAGGGAGGPDMDFAGMNTDFGEGNTDNGNGNWFSGDNNQADGNGNWNFGSGNQTEGNGNWYLSGEDSIPFNNLFAGENNPLGSGSEMPTNGFGGGNNPVFAGGGSIPAPVGDGSIPDSAKNPVGSDNETAGNGNWYFGGSNETNGNGNWYFGDGNQTEGNGNWSLGENNQVKGNGNRPTGSDNSIEGNGNQISGSGNDVFGNRFSTDSDNTMVYGNGDRYFMQDADGNLTLVSDESASDPNLTFDFDEIVGQAPATDSSVDDLINFGGASSGSDGQSGEDMDALIRQSPFGRLLDLPGIEGAEDIFGSVGGGIGGDNPFGGGAAGGAGGGFGGGNPWANWDPVQDGNPFTVGDEPNVPAA